MLKGKADESNMAIENSTRDENVTSYFSHLNIIFVVVIMAGILRRFLAISLGMSPSSFHYIQVFRRVFLEFAKQFRLFLNAG